MLANAKHAHKDIIKMVTTVKLFVFPVFPGNTKTPPLKQPAKHARPIGFPIKLIKRNAKRVVTPRGPT
jgi:hypothetical protein